MKKSYLFYILAILIVLSFVIYYVKVQPELRSPEIVLSKAFERSGAKAVNAEIYFWGRIDNQEYSSMDDLKKLASGFSKHLGMLGDNEFSTEAVKNDLVQEVELNGVMDGNRVVDISVQLSKIQEENSERFISVTVTEDASNFDLGKTRKEVMQVFEKLNIKPKVNSCLTGSFNGKLDKMQLNDICRKVFEEAGAKRVEGMSDGSLISVSAYSPSIKDYIEVNEDRVNINIALRYNSYEDRTYIWLGTPVITTEY